MIFHKKSPYRIAGVIGLILFIAFAYEIYINWPASYVPPKEETGVHQVLIKNNRAEPDELSVPVGEYLQINSADGHSHVIEYGRGTGKGDDKMEVLGVAMNMGSSTAMLRSGEFGADEAFRVQIKTAGTFFFRDSKNPKIDIQVVGYVPDATSTKKVLPQK